MESVINSSEGIEVVKRLSQMTTKGEISWEAVADSGQAFYALLPRYEVKVESRDRDDGHPYVLSLYSKKLDREVDEYETGVGSDPILLVRVEKLYKEAKKQALGLTDIAEELMEDLQSLRARDYGPDEAPF